MNKANRRDFDKVAASWDEKPQRRLLAAAVAGGIAADIALQPGMQALEFGCGTGLVGLQLAAALGELTAADSSAGMLEELRKKSESLGLENVTPLLIPADRWTLPPASFDLVFSSMVLHHIPDTEALFRNLHQVLKPGGFLALADLEQEDGTFHDDPTGIAHHGFDPQALLRLLARLGFTDLRSRTVHTIRKPGGDEEATYPVFMITGRKA